MKLSPVQQAKDHRDELGKEAQYQLVMHPDTLVSILDGTKIGEDNPGVFEHITQNDLPVDVIKLHGASIHLDDRVLVGAVNRRPC